MPIDTINKLENIVETKRITSNDQENDIMEEQLDDQVSKKSR